jgi:hypothetical protein
LIFLFLFAVLNPPHDAEGLHDVQSRTVSTVGSAMWQGINGAFFDFAPLTLAWLALLGAWCFQRKRPQAVLLPILIAVQGIFYGFYGWPQHQGTIFIAAIAGLWIAWPTAAEEEAFSVEGQWTHKALVVGLVCLLGYQAWNAAVVIRNDYRYPYSGAEDAARYLKSVGADQQPIMGALYGMVAVEAYFDHNIQANRPTAYFHHGDPFLTVSGDQLAADLARFAPEYFVLPVWDESEVQANDAFLQANGYSLVHRSKGYLLHKRSWVLRQDYLIYHRN